MDGVREPVNQDSLSHRVVDTITEVRALLQDACTPVNGQCLRDGVNRMVETQENCPVSDILDFLQQRMEDGSMPSTLRFTLQLYQHFTPLSMGAQWETRSSYQIFERCEKTKTPLALLQFHPGIWLWCWRR